MNIEQLKIGLNSLENTVDFSCTNIVFNSNLKLNYIEDVTPFSAIDSHVMVFMLSFTFYGEYFQAHVSTIDIESDNEYRMTHSGPSQLFDSFETNTRDEYWEHIKLICKRYVELYEAENKLSANN